MIENPKTGDELLWCVPERGTVSVVDGAQIAVPDDQVAVLVHEGDLLASFGPGRHVLGAGDVPEAVQPGAGIEVKIYYVNTSERVPLRWGGLVSYHDPTVTPREPDEVRSHGTIDIHITGARQLIAYHLEKAGACAHDQALERIRVWIVGAMSQVLNEAAWPAVDPLVLHREVAGRVQAALAARLAAMGAECTSLTIQALERRTPIDPGHRMPIKMPGEPEAGETFAVEPGLLAVSEPDSGGARHGRATRRAGT